MLGEVEISPPVVGKTMSHISHKTHTFGREGCSGNERTNCLVREWGMNSTCNLRDPWMVGQADQSLGTKENNGD